MNVLVTGSSGFLGKWVVKALMQRPEVKHIIGASRRATPFSCKNQNSIEGLDWVYETTMLDITDARETKSVLDYFKPDTIIHLAANAIVKENANNPTEITKTNVLGTHNLLAYCKEGARFGFASSATVYGNAYNTFANKNSWTMEGCPCNPTSVYGATKAACEQYITAYNNKVGATIYRLVANVGPGATHGVLPDLLAKLESHSETLEILGDKPGSTKPYAHVRDTANFIVASVLNSAHVGKTMNVGPKDSLTIEELAKYMMETMKITKPVQWLGAAANWNGDNRFVQVGNLEAVKCGYKPQYDTSKDAIIQTIKELRFNSQ